MSVGEGSKKKKTPDWAESLLSKKEVVREWYPQGGPTAVVQLLSRAIHALKKEDEWLHSSLAANASEYEKCSHGLAYHVFEHNLVLPIFREWARTHKVIWDENVEVKRKAFVDLQVQARQPPREWYLFEAKWWARGKARRLFPKDVAKLTKASHRGDGYVLAFWCGHWHAWQKDFSGSHFNERYMAGEPAFAGAFPAHVYLPQCKDCKPQGSDDQGYFAMVAWKVS